MPDPWDVLRHDPQEMTTAVLTIKAAGVSKEKLASFLRCERQDINGWMKGEHKPDPIRACLVLAVLDGVSDPDSRETVVQNVRNNESSPLLDVLAAGLRAAPRAGGAAGSGVGIGTAVGAVGALGRVLVGGLGGIFGAGVGAIGPPATDVDPFSPEGANAWHNLAPAARRDLAGAVARAIRA